MRNLFTGKVPFLSAAVLAIAAVPAAAAVTESSPQISPAKSYQDVMPAASSQADVWAHGRGRHNHDRRGYRNNRGDRNYGEPIYANTRVWRGRDGRSYCRRRDGTTGLIVGGAVGALLGREVDGGYDRSAGTIIGAGLGALLGREVARGGGRCR